MDGLILLSMPLLDVYSDIRLALALVFFVYILNWAKAAVGSPKIAVLLGAVLAYLTIYRHPDLVWVFSLEVQLEVQLVLMSEVKLEGNCKIMFKHNLKEEILSADNF